MRTFILKGNTIEKEQFIKAFINDNNIAAFNIHRFTEPIKLADAKEIKKTVSRASISGGARLFVIDSEVNVEAQNALLKTIEEFPQDSTIMFLSENLLPTIYSRCSVINLGQKTQGAAASFSVLDFIDSENMDHSAASALLFADLVLANKSDNIVADLVLSLRADLLVAIKNHEVKKIALLFQLVKEASQIYPLIQANNLNSRLAVEKLFIKTAKELRLPS